MRVVWIVPGFSRDAHDWCIPALLDLARDVAIRCDLHIVALHYPYQRATYPVGEAMVHSLGGSSRGGAHTLPLWREAARTIEALRPDVLHAFWAYEPGVIAAWLARRGTRRVPTIIHLAGGELIHLRDIRYGLRGKLHTRWLMQWALRRARIVTAGSRYLIDRAEKFGVDREIVFAPLGVDGALFMPRSPAPFPEMKQSISGEGGAMILNVGSLEPVKGQAMLLRSFKRVCEVIPQARLIIAGKGRLEGTLRALSQQLQIDERVGFAGEIPHHELPALYRSAALFVQSSRHEAQGMALLEATMCGVPLVGTGVGALADLSPEAAIATPVGDEVSLAQAIISLLRDPLRRDRLGRAARDVVAREYALTRAVDRAMMMYEELTMNNEQ
jgi:glycosyltransferase involved in cell wall biosynthesis